MITRHAIYILDSGVFLSGAQNLFADKPCVTVYSVVEEMKSAKASIEMDRFLQSGLEVLEPSREGIAEAETQQKKTQDKVSHTDIFLVALAIDFRKKKKDAVVVSDDYAVQNLCRLLKLEFMPVSQEGIKKGLQWVGRCPACGFKTSERICPNCGSRVKFGARVVK